MESSEKNKIKVLSRIRYLREEEQITQQELANLVGVTETSIQNWERGRSGIDHIERVAKLCDALDCEPNDLIEYVLYENTNNLGKWWQSNFTGVFDSTWENPEDIFAKDRKQKKGNQPRDSEGKEDKRIAKIINFPDNKGVILLLKFHLEKENKIGVTVRLCKLLDDQYLPSDLKLELTSKSAKTRQQIQSSDEDILIQTYYPIKRKKGSQFTLKVSLQQNSIIENFQN